uniref:Uncharacterized protein n=1 Tax=Peronospora matthiolae TaxID=2874970 RepID=A0AAV1V1W8_9STRA
MKTSSFLYPTLLAAAAVQAQEPSMSTRNAPVKPPGPAPPPASVSWKDNDFHHDQIQPFAEPEPKTPAEKAAVRFKPQIFFVNGCHSYAAVDAAGRNSGGLQPKGLPDGKCKGSGFGSQIYGRSAPFGNKWAIVYALYFPKDMKYLNHGYRHAFEHVVLWFDDIALKDPKLLAVTPRRNKDYLKLVSPDAQFMDGDSILLFYESEVEDAYHQLSCSTHRGEFQPLIMWEQLTNEARTALETVDWGRDKMPLGDVVFNEILKEAWPFAPLE